jgi:hypothetical protein
MFPYPREHYSLPECLDTQWLSVRLLLHYHRKDESATVQRVADGVELVDQVVDRPLRAQTVHKPLRPRGGRWPGNGFMEMNRSIIWG